MRNNYFKAVKFTPDFFDEHGRTEKRTVLHKVEPFDDSDRDDIVRAYELIAKHQREGWTLSVWRTPRDTGRWDSLPTVGQPVRAAVLP